MTTSAAPASTRSFDLTAKRAVPSAAALIVLVLLLGGILAALGRPDHQPTAVEATDEAQVLDPIRLQEDLGELKTHKPTRIVVYVRKGEATDNLNEKTLQWARQHPEKNLLSADGRKWADGLLLISVSVESASGPGRGQVGTYFGEDIKIESVDRQQELQELGYDSFRAGDWEAGVRKVAQGAADVMARPFWANPWVILIGTVLLLAAAVWNLLAVIRMRSDFNRAAAGLDDNTRVVHEEVSKTEFIPDVGFGDRVKTTAQETLTEYTDALEQRQVIDDTGLFAINMLNFALNKRIKDFSTSDSDISDAVRTLRNANRLYAKSEDWETIWRDEVEETARHFKEAAESSTLATVVKSKDVGTEQARQYQLELDQLRQYARTQLVTFDELLERGLRAEPEEMGRLLEQISLLRSELSHRVQELIRSAKPKSSEASRYVDDSIRKAMRGAHRRRGSITGYYDHGSFYSPSTFSAGYLTGMQSYRSAQSSSSSSGGSNTSYGSSGGFSGAGSSSRF